MLGLCDMVLRLLAREPSTTRRAQTEAAAIAELYYQRSPGLHVDPGLVERLLWWEGIDPAEVQREGPSLHRMHSNEPARAA